MNLYSYNTRKDSRGSEGFGGAEFIIANDNYTPKLIGHELGHCLKLHHPFGKLSDSDNKVSDEGHQRESMSQNSTENVMDYDMNRMNTFWLWQWIIMNNNIKYYQK